MKYTIDDTNTKSDNEYVIEKKEKSQSSPIIPEEQIELINQRIDTIVSKNTFQDTSIATNSTNISTLQTSVGTLQTAVGTNTGNITTLQSNYSNLAIKTVADFKTAILNYVYPVGSVAIFYNTVNPSTTLGGTWQKISSGKFLEQSDVDENLGTYVQQGLPNLKGSVGTHTWNATVDGVFSSKSTGKIWRYDSLESTYTTTAEFDASKYNSIYGNSDNVQPNSFKVNIWKRTA